MTRFFVSIACMFFISFGAAAETLVLKAGHSANPDEPYHIGLQALADEVKARTNGEVEIQIFPNNQLGNEKEMIEGLLLGTVDIAVPSNGVVTNFVEELGIFDLPFLFRDREHMYKVMDGPVGQELDQAMAAKGFKLLAFYEAGIRHIMTTKKPIETYEDLAGLKIRTMQVPAHVSAFNAFQANATPMAYSELYGALQSGVIDGAEAANTNYNSKKFYEVAPYWATVAWTALVADLIMSKEKFDSLPEEVQSILQEAALKSAAVERQTYADSDAALLSVLQEKGVTVSTPDTTPFREASKAVYDEFVTTDAQKARLQQILATE